MAHGYPNLVKETTTTTGTGNIVLAGSVAGFFTFGSSLEDGDTVEVVITGGGQTEAVVCTYIEGNNELSRDDVIRSTNGDELVDFSGGEKMVYATAFGRSVSNIVGGAALQIPYQTGEHETAFIPAPDTPGQVLSFDGTDYLFETPGGGGGGGGHDVQEFDEDDTWTKPDGAPADAEVIVYLLGGGGGGGSGARHSTSDVNYTNGGGGGGGAHRARREFLAGDLTGTVAVTVGPGGAGATAITDDDTNGNDGSPGGPTTFGTYALANGGLGGPGGKSDIFENFVEEWGLGAGLSTNYDGGTGGEVGGASAFRATEAGGSSGGMGYIPGATDDYQNANSSALGGLGGGGGGGIATLANVFNPGGKGGGASDVLDGEAGLGADGGATAGANGSDGTTPSKPGRLAGQGGGGGASRVSGGPGGAGGAGGTGSGGGGGGATRNGLASGPGGNGGPGYARIVTRW